MSARFALCNGSARPTWDELGNEFGAASARPCTRRPLSSARNALTAFRPCPSRSAPFRRVNSNKYIISDKTGTCHEIWITPALLFCVRLYIYGVVKGPQRFNHNMRIQTCRAQCAAGPDSREVLPFPVSGFSVRKPRQEKTRAGGAGGPEHCHAVPGVRLRREMGDAAGCAGRGSPVRMKRNSYFKYGSVS